MTTGTGPTREPPSRKRAWTERWERLQRAGISKRQAELIYAILDDTRAFHSRTLADSAWVQLQEVYAAEMNTDRELTWLTREDATWSIGIYTNEQLEAMSDTEFAKAKAEVLAQKGARNA